MKTKYTVSYKRDLFGTDRDPYSRHRRFCKTFSNLDEVIDFIHYLYYKTNNTINDLLDNVTVTRTFGLSKSKRKEIRKRIKKI